MITLRYVPGSDWPDLARRFRDFAFEQSLTYAEPAAARIGGKAHYVVLERDGRLLAAAAVRVRAVPLLGRGIAWIASGPLTQPMEGDPPDDATMTAILATLRDEFALKRGHVLRFRLPGIAFPDMDRITPLAGAAGYAPTDRAPSYRSIAVSLRRTEAETLAGLDHKWRTNLRFVQKLNLSLDRGNSPELQARFKKLFCSVQAAKGFAPDITPEFHYDLSGPDYRMEVLIATKDGVDQAGIVIAHVGNSVIYLFGATGEAGRDTRAGYFLTWTGVTTSLGKGLDWYDLGGIDAEANPDVYRFKNRMNGTHFFTAPFQTQRPGPVSALILRAEALRARMKKG